MTRGWGRAAGFAAVALVAAALGPVTAAEAADGSAKKAKRGDLVVQDVAGTATGRTVRVAATVKNEPGKKKGKKTAASTVAFLLSADAVAGAGDSAMGSLGVPRLKPKRSATVGATFAVPSTVAAGSYHVIACVDPRDDVEEKREQNNCSASAVRVAVPASTPPALPPGATVTISYTSSPPGMGTVTATATNGTCTPAPDPVMSAGSCTVTAGVGTVVLTAAGVLGFSGYSPAGGGPCDGTASGTTMTFTAPTTNKSCLATFPLTPPFPPFP